MTFFLRHLKHLFAFIKDAFTLSLSFFFLKVFEKGIIRVFGLKNVNFIKNLSSFLNKNFKLNFLFLKYIRIINFDENFLNINI